MARRPRAATALLALGMALASCEEAPTRIVLLIDADAPLRPRLTAIHVSMQREGDARVVDGGHYPLAGQGGTAGATDGGGALALHDLRASPRDGLLVLQPRDPADARRVYVTVEGLVEAAQRVSHTTLTSFVRGQTLYLSVVLTASCVPVTCAAGTTCVEGRCEVIAARALPTEPPAVDRDGAAPGDDIVVADAVDGASDGDRDDASTGLDAAREAGDDVRTDGGPADAVQAEADADAAVVRDASEDADVAAAMDVVAMEAGGDVSGEEPGADARDEPPDAERVDGLSSDGALDLADASTDDGGLDAPESVADAVAPDAPPDVADVAMADAGGCTASPCRCAAGRADCDGVPTNGCEVDLRASNDHCGACGRACAASTTCDRGCCGGMCSIAVDGGHCCALRADGTIYCWGGNSYGALGDATMLASFTPVRARVAPPAVAIGAGQGSTAAILPDGSVFAWGENGFYGMLGIGTMDPSSLGGSPVPDVIQAVSVAGAYHHYGALIQDGTVRTWGGNELGQLGDGTTATRHRPTVVRNVDDAMMLAVGQEHLCAVRAGGTVVCWGDNTNGELGDGTTTGRLTAVQVSSLTDVTWVTMGHDHSCARRTDGSVWCWGRGGQLGNGAIMGSLTPIRVAGLPAVVKVEAGIGHTCVLTVAGNVYCWGNPSEGELGNGSTSGGLSPVRVLNLPTAALDLDAGGLHACSLLNDGSVRCWGQNGSGSLGDGTVTNRSLPVRVMF